MDNPQNPADLGGFLGQWFGYALALAGAGYGLYQRRKVIKMLEKHGQTLEKTHDRLEQNIQEEAERRIPKVGLMPSTYVFSESLGETTRFEGFTVVNKGHVDVIITSFGWELGGGDLDENSHIFPLLGEVMTYKGSTISTMSLPHRLSPGESFNAMYDPEELESHLKPANPDEPPKALQPSCRDIHGNEYTFEAWVRYNGNTTTYIDDPRHPWTEAGPPQ